jgi:hypothetical protein
MVDDDDDNDSVSVQSSVQQSSHEQKWDSNFEALVAHKKKEGNFTVPVSKNPKLAAWIKHQKSLHKSGKLKEERKKKLESIGLDLQVKSMPRGRTWEESLQSLIAFQEEHGHCRVSREMDSRLFSWVKNQRSFEKDGRLRADRRKKLKAIGFEFANPEKTWTATPSSAVETSHLTKQDSGREGSSSETGKLKIHWETRFHALVAFKQKHGHCNIKRQMDSKLFDWVGRQKVRQRAGTLADDRQRKLESIGLEFHNGNIPAKNDEIWETQFQALVAFQEKYGHCNPIRPQMDARLFNWVKNQQSHQKAGKLKEDRQCKLESVGFRWRGAEETPAKRASREISTELQSTDNASSGNEVSTDDTDKNEVNESLDSTLPVSATCGEADKKTCKRKKRAGPDHVMDGEKKCKRSKKNNNAAQQTTSKETVLMLSPEKLKNRTTKPPGKYDQLWEAQFQALVAFQQKYGHCNPICPQMEMRLSHWVKNQQSCHKAGKLKEDCQRRLESIGFKWRGAEEASVDSISNSRQGSMKSNDIILNSREVSTKSADRTSYNREASIEGTGDQNTKDTFNSIPPVSATTCRTVKRTSKGKKRAGPEHVMDVEKKHKQSKKNKNVNEGNNTKETALILSPATQKKKVEATSARAYSKKWKRGFQAFLAYKDKYGSLNVSKANDPALARWVKKQRSKYRKGKLKQDRTKQLEGAGFDWKIKLPSDKKWKKRFKALVAFKDKHGHCQVTKQQDKKLFKWVTNQKFLEKKGLLKEDWWVKLAAIGLEWHPADEVDAKDLEQREQGRPSISNFVRLLKLSPASALVE